MNIKKTVLLSPLVAILLASNVYAAQNFSIKAQSLQEAIQSISKKAKIPFIVDAVLLKGKTSKSIKNIEGLQNALNKLLEKSGLKASIEDGAIIIKQIIIIKNTYSSNLGEVEVIERSGNITEKSGSYTISSMNSATKMNLSILDTPQSVSVVTREKMNDFSLNTINDVLHQVPGITVELREPNRAKFTARGFAISNLQMDGLSLPLDAEYTMGGVATEIFDHIEVTKGATALTSGAGDPSASINLIRKRPTKEAQHSVDVSLGSWNNKKIMVDSSDSINENFRARIVASYEKSDSYLDRYNFDNNLFYAIFEADLSDDTLLSFGFSRYQNNTNEGPWGSLPLYYTNGNATSYDVSKNTSSDWSFWDTTKSEAFIQIDQNLKNDWKLQSVFKHNTHKERSNLFYMYGTPTQGDESGLKASQSDYSIDVKENLFDLSVNGPFTLANREHEAVIGVSIAQSSIIKDSLNADNGYPIIPNFGTWNGSIDKPNFITNSKPSADFTNKQIAIYAASNINITDSLSLLLGSRISNWETKGYSYKNSVNSKDKNVLTPYAGIVYKLNDNQSIYASYTTSFKPQEKIDANFKQIEASEGKNYELGTKATFFDGALNGTFSLFKTKQKNVASKGAKISGIQTYDVDEGLESKGFEVELVGEIYKNLNLSFGYTNLRIKDLDDNVAKTYIPQETIKISTSYNFESLPALKIGTSLRWQDDIYRNQKLATQGPKTGEMIVSKQKAYTIIDIMSSYKISKNVSTSFNIKNITNKKYYSSLYWAQGSYGAPRSYHFNLKWTF